MTGVFIPTDVREIAARCTAGLLPLSRNQRREEIDFMRAIHGRIADAIMADRRHCLLEFTAAHREERSSFS